MFRRLRIKLALQFTGLVFGLMVVLGVVFIAIEFTDVNRQLDARLQRQAEVIGSTLELPISVEQARWLHREAFNVRLVSGGETLYASDIFARLGVGPDAARLSTVRADGSSYRVMTTALPGRPGVVLQLAGQDRIGPAELPGEIAVFFIAALIVTALTAVLGLWFARRSLAPAEQMTERLTQFTHDASHELHTPLAIVNTELDLALRTGEYEKHILAAKEELKAGVALLDDLLGLAQLDTVTLDGKQVDLADVTRAEVDRLLPSAEEKGVRFETDLDRRVLVRGDGGLLAQLVANLVGNAIKFCRPGDVVTISVSQDSLRVADTGPGIVPDALPHVFDRFYQADSSRAQEGHGLGLAICRTIADAHGWRITAESAAGHGTRFVVWVRE